MNIEDRSADDLVVLIVEDDSVLAFLLQIVMDENGISAEVYGTAEDALETVRKYDHLVRLVLTDVDLPGEMNGVALSEVLDVECPEIPVILMSGRPLMEQNSYRMFLQKPIGMEKLIDAIKSSISR
ncbi:response regulator [Pseudomonas nicosulfuronedens]|uniref:response regulator n=1 Tax=Pseudomonas nicosulfuronedens TaxID=2571105 RepID=UPI00244A55B6|nr:response regulator [Pseudomonas nicosulfuronedens]MDH1011636.1 response regulator [Pseudomonas nicosulfuronedens]MDH1980375.1 response regulator [Pseudomonas nicosulfuronedens]MDH2027373.1 response regulator [Pseudomonas nicosulfuronedens]